MRPHIYRLPLLLLVGVLAGCQPGQGDEGPDGGGGAGSDGGGNTPEDGGSGGDGGSTGGTQAPFPRAAACVSLTSEGSMGRKPVDIIMVIDNSSSMTAEIEAVESNVNNSFAEIIGQSGLDYRVILVAKHGSASADQSVCIRGPLSETGCSPVPSKPANGARFFHYDIEIESKDAFAKLLATFDATDVHGDAQGGWRTWLRPDSAKTFIVITDDESNLSPSSFESQLFAKADGAFGDAERRNYVFHSIIGIVPNSPASEPWLPTDAKKGQKCSSASAAGARYEDLSILTGGLRFPVCETDSYDAVFQAAAREVIAGAQASCDFTPEAPPQGTSYAQAYIEYVPGSGGDTEYFLEVDNPNACTARGFTREASSNRITLCTAACERVKADQTAKLSVLYACEVDIE
jgi:hypothetical protein